MAYCVREGGLLVLVWMNRVVALSQFIALAFESAQNGTRYWYFFKTHSDRPKAPLIFCCMPTALESVVVVVRRCNKIGPCVVPSFLL